MDGERNNRVPRISGAMTRRMYIGALGNLQVSLTAIDEILTNPEHVKNSMHKKSKYHDYINIYM